MLSPPSFPLVGSPQRLAGARIFLMIPNKSEGFWIHPPEADKSQNDIFETNF